MAIIVSHLTQPKLQLNIVSHINTSLLVYILLNRGHILCLFSVVPGKSASVSLKNLSMIIRQVYQDVTNGVIELGSPGHKLHC